METTTANMIGSERQMAAEPVGMVISGRNTYDFRGIIKELGKASFSKTEKAWKVVFYEGEPVLWPAGKYSIKMTREAVMDKLRSNGMEVAPLYV